MNVTVKSDTIFGLEAWQIKLFGLPLAVLIIAVASLILVVIPTYSQLMTTNDLIKSKNVQVKNLEEKRNYLMNLDQDEVESNASYLNMSLLKNKDAYFLVNIVRSVVEKYDFRIDAFSISPGEIESPAEVSEGTNQGLNEKFGLTSIPVDLTLLGSKSRYVEVVKALERTLPILSVNNFEIKNTGEITQIKLVVETYFVPEKIETNLEKLSLADLTLSPDEAALVKTLTEYDKTIGTTIDGGLIKQGEYRNYGRENPFEL